MNAKQKLHQAHLAEWATKLSDQKASGLTVRQWCDQNHFSIHKYNYCKHLLKEEVVDQMLPDIVPLPAPAPLSAPDHTIPQDTQSAQIVHDRPVRANRTNSTNRTTRANIRFCVDGVSLELEPSIDEDFLRVLIRAVHYA